MFCSLLVSWSGTLSLPLHTTAECPLIPPSSTSLSRDLWRGTSVGVLRSLPASMLPFNLNSSVAPFDKFVSFLFSVNGAGLVVSTFHSCSCVAMSANLSITSGLRTWLLMTGLSSVIVLLGTSRIVPLYMLILPAVKRMEREERRERKRREKVKHR